MMGWRFADERVFARFWLPYARQWLLCAKIARRQSERAYAVAVTSYCQAVSAVLWCPLYRDDAQNMVNPEITHDASRFCD